MAMIEVGDEEIRISGATELESDRLLREISVIESGYHLGRENGVFCFKPYELSMADFVREAVPIIVRALVG